MNHKKNWLIFTISLILIIYFSKITISKIEIRKLIDSNAESLNRCADGPNYLISYYTKGGNQTFDTFINRDYVRPIIEISKGGKKSDYIGYYIERLAINFIYFSFAILIIIFWIIFSFCLCKPKCCFIEKKGEKNITFISFIISIIFFMGCLACSISAFVYAHKFENYLDGAICGVERIYYNMKDGQIKEKGENWLGLTKIPTILEQISQLDFSSINVDSFDFSQDLEDYNNSIKEINKECGELEKGYVTNITNEVDGKINNYFIINENLINSLKGLNNEKDNLDIAKNSISNIGNNILSFYNDIMKNYEYYRKVFKGIGFYFTLVIYSILLIVSVGCTLFLFLYYFLNSNKFFLLITQIFWHLLIFLSIILFILVGFFGILSMGVNDGMAYIKYVFGKENLKNDKIVIRKYYEFINTCLYDDKGLIGYYDIENYNSTYSYYKILKINKTIIKEIKINAIEKAINDLKAQGLELNKKFVKLNETFKKTMEKIFNRIENNIEGELNSKYSSLENTLSLNLNSTYFFHFMDCSFLKYDLEMSYIIAYDFQDKVDRLFIITIFAAFFSIIAVIFMLMTILRKKDKMYDDDNNSENSSNSIKENLNEKKKDFFIENENIDKNEV